MSIPESAWPDNGVAYMQQSKTSAQYMTIEASPPDEDGFSSICYGTFDANNRGLPPGTIVIRQSAEIANLRADNEELARKTGDLPYAVIALTAQRDELKAHVRELTELALKTIPSDWRPGHCMADGPMPWLAEYVEELQAEREKLRDELEKERMRLCACGVVAMSDTESSAKEARDMHPDYRSASCDDVARRVDECIALRAEVARLQSRLIVREHVCLDFADNPRDITTMQAPADTIDEVRSALRGTAAMYRDAIAELDLLKSQSEDERKITGILLAHLGLDEIAAFTEAGVPNPGRLKSILAYEHKS